MKGRRGQRNAKKVKRFHPANPAGMAQSPRFARNDGGRWYTRREEHVIGAEGTRRAPIMPLRELVRLYLDHTGEYGKAVALLDFGLSKAGVERIFSGYDEDYHISRFFHFTEAQGQTFMIDGVPATHVSIDAEIETIL